MVVDLSQAGCRIATLTQVPSGTNLVVQLMLPDDLPPITVKSCVVRWSRGHEFGVQFLETREEDRARLSRFIGKM
jgi:PilZ domain